MLKFNVRNPDGVIAYLDSLCEQGKAKCGVHLKRVTQRDSGACTININNLAYYTSFDSYDLLRAKVSVGEIWR